MLIDRPAAAARIREAFTLDENITAVPTAALPDLAVSLGAGRAGTGGTAAARPESGGSPPAGQGR